MQIELTEEEINTVLAALQLTSTRYNTTHNGGIHYDFSFTTVGKQNEYAAGFESVNQSIRSQIKS